MNMKLNFNKFFSFTNKKYGLGYVSMNILSSEKKGINLENYNDREDAHIIMPKELLSNFKNIIKNYNVAKKNIFIWDYNGNIINKYTKGRLNNDSGDIEIKVDSGLISDIIINKDVNSKMYIVLNKYDEYFNLVSKSCRDLLLQEDCKKFLNENYLFFPKNLRKLEMNFIITPKVREAEIQKYIEGSKIHYKVFEEKYINKYLAETIFGKMCYGKIYDCQVNLKLDNCQIEEIYRIDKNINVDFTPRSNGIIEIYSKTNIKKELEFLILFKMNKTEEPVKLSSCNNEDKLIKSETFNIRILDGLEFSILERILSDYKFYKDYNKLTSSEKVKIYDQNIFRDKIFNYMFDKRNEVKTNNNISKNIVNLGNNIYKKILNNIHLNSTIIKYNCNSLTPSNLTRFENFNNCYETNNSLLKRGCSNGFELTNNFREMEL